MQCTTCGHRWTRAYCGDHTARRSAPRPAGGVRRAEPAMLDLVYRAFLAALPLRPEHRRALRQRGLSDAEMGRRLYRSMPQRGRARVVRALVDQFGAETCAQIPGLYVASGDGRDYWTLAGAVGLLIPVRDVEGHIIALKVRADAIDAEPRYTTISSKKHGGPSPGAPAHVPLHTTADTATVRVTEGELKADIATALTGILTISMPGVAMWRRVLPILEQLGVSAVRLAFDADWRNNPHVAQALGALTHALLKAGLDVRAESWDAVLGKGIDDMLVAGHRPTERSAGWALRASLRGQAVTRGETTPWHAAATTGRSTPWH